MSDESIKVSALFYFLITLDDKIATEAAAKTLKLFNQKFNPPTSKQIKFIPRESLSPSEEMKALIQLCLQEWRQIKTHFQKERIQIINTKSLHWPEHIDLSPWKEFQKQAPEQELIAVTWVHVLGVSESLLASALNQSEGTIRYRVGNGLSLLGQLNRPNISSLQFS